MATEKRDERVEMLELGIDEQLGSELRRLITDEAQLPEEHQSYVAAIARAAYGRGVMDGLKYPVKMRQWVESYGYQIWRKRNGRR